MGNSGTGRQFLVSTRFLDANRNLFAWKRYQQPAVLNPILASAS
jgi:hypothetical protein